MAVVAGTGTFLTSGAAAEVGDKPSTLGEVSSVKAEDNLGCHGILVQGLESSSEYTVQLSDYMFDIDVEAIPLGYSGYDIDNENGVISGTIGENDIHGFASRFSPIIESIEVHEGSVAVELQYNPLDREECNVVGAPPDNVEQVEIYLEGDGDYGFGFWEAHGPLSAVDTGSSELEVCLPAGDSIICHWSHSGGVQTEELDIGNGEQKYDFAAGSLDDEQHVYAVEKGLLDTTDTPGHFYLTGSTTVTIDIGSLL
ncbi:hypothetical protein C482_16738 [Natrialba chahannaoensis JCM 10990]|uniref:Uncharacterized protein n=2 Tax=Natrialba chahannaoensis TaxID=68911 RepID=M0ABR4_9EURY|nr:hypothetical protein C482_16738 [Natrialba chahannaoensis JCM 10990]